MVAAWLVVAAVVACAPTAEPRDAGSAPQRADSVPVVAGALLLPSAPTPPRPDPSLPAPTTPPWTAAPPPVLVAPMDPVLVLPGPADPLPRAAAAAPGPPLVAPPTPEPIPVPPSVAAGVGVGLALPPPRPTPAVPAPTALPDTGVVEGIASWYGPGFAGRKTASGEIFDPGQLTAAHRTLPFGSVVRVTHLESGQSVLVRINDRGPFEPTRLIDLSQAAAEALGMLSAGVAPVRLELLTAGLGDLKLAVAADLDGYEARSTRFPPGQLVVLEGSGGPLLVRVVAGEAGFGADLFVSPAVFDALGPITAARLD